LVGILLENMRKIFRKYCKKISLEISLSLTKNPQKNEMISLSNESESRQLSCLLQIKICLTL